ncbi:MAG: helix-turn-helix transcriptional regulator [Lachnospiraceae bacterium]
MENKTELQYQFCSRVDDRKFCSFDLEIMEEKTRPILHQTSRFLYVNKGRGTLKINEKQYEIRENTLISLLPFDCTEITEVEATLQVYVVKYNFVVINDAIKSIFNVDNQKVSILQQIQDHPVIYCNEATGKEVCDIFDRIKGEVGIECTLQFPEERKLRTVYIVNLLVELMVVSQRQEVSKEMAKKSATKKGDRTEIFRYIYTHLSEKLTLKKLAKLFYMSESSISKYVMETTGLTFNNLVNEIKVAKTLNYLMYTDYTLDQLAMILGYVDAAHISKVFESRIGMKINEYRKTYRTVQEICNFEERRIGYNIVSYIFDNHKEEITAHMVAARFEITVAELNKILILQVEHSFLEFLHILRINSACELLVKTNMPITDIAIEVGFNTVKTFTRNFIQQKHITPSNFRLQVHAEKGECEE